jgi:hypothetical protein
MWIPELGHQRLGHVSAGRFAGQRRAEFVYFIHASTMRPSFLHTQTRNAQTTHQHRKVTGTVNKICPRASIGLWTFIAITQEASKVRATALVVLCLQMDTSAGAWFCGTGSDVVIVAVNMTHNTRKRYMTNTLSAPIFWSLNSPKYFGVYLSPIYRYSTLSPREK